MKFILRTSILIHMSDPLLPHPRVGKARANLPDEYYLAQFLQDIQNDHPSWNTDTPACEWDKVECNEKGEIYAIGWSDQFLTGTPLWTHLSSIMCTHLNLNLNRLTGGIDLHLLPINILNFESSFNNFDGTLNLEEMPPSLGHLSLGHCKLHGPISLRMLPPDVQVVTLSHNMLSGSLYLGALQGMYYLDLSHNHFSGPVDLHLSRLISLRLDHNQNLSGEYDPIWFHSTPEVEGTQIKILPKRGSYRCFLPLRYVFDSNVWHF